MAKITSFPFIIKCPKKDYPERSFKITGKVSYDDQIYRAQPFDGEIHKDVAILILEEYNKVNLVESLKLLSQKSAGTIIAEIYDYFEKENKFYIIMELAQQSFSVYIDQMISIQQKYKLCQQVVEAVDYLHENGLVHGNLSPQSFALIDEKTQQFKLINFGIITNNLKINNIQYQSPEDKVNNKVHTKEGDIWALGCILYEILARKQLFQNDSEMESLNQKIFQLQVFRLTKQKIQEMLYVEPVKRLKLKIIIDHLIDSQQNFDDHYSLMHSYSQNDNLDQLVLDLKYHYEANYLNESLLNDLEKLQKAIQKQHNRLTTSNQETRQKVIEQQQKGQAQIIQLLPPSNQTTISGQIFLNVQNKAEKPTLQAPFDLTNQNFGMISNVNNIENSSLNQNQNQTLFNNNNVNNPFPYLNRFPNQNQIMNNFKFQTSQNQVQNNNIFNNAQTPSQNQNQNNFPYNTQAKLQNQNQMFQNQQLF